MTIKNSDYVMLGGAAEGELVELTELDLSVIMGGYEPGYQESNPNANGWDLRGSSSGNGGAEGAGGQGEDQYHGSDGAGGAGGGGGGDRGQSHPTSEPYPSRPEPTSAGEALFQNWVSRTISAGESWLRDGSQILSIPILVDVIFPPKPQA